MDLVCYVTSGWIWSRSQGLDIFGLVKGAECRCGFSAINRRKGPDLNGGAASKQRYVLLDVTGNSKICLWYLYDLSIWFYDISMICLWYVYDMSMIFLWYFYDILWWEYDHIYDFHGFPTSMIDTDSAWYLFIWVYGLKKESILLDFP